LLAHHGSASDAPLLLSTDDLAIFVFGKEVAVSSARYPEELGEFWIET
jgi:hypothetical protein